MRQIVAAPRLHLRTMYRCPGEKQMKKREVILQYYPVIDENLYSPLSGGFDSKGRVANKSYVRNIPVETRSIVL